MAESTRTPRTTSDPTTPTEAENERIEEAASVLRRYGFGHLAEAVERMAEVRTEERLKRPDREQLNEAAEHLRGMIDSLDEHVGHEEIAEQLEEARRMVLASFPDEPEAREEPMIDCHHWEPGKITKRKGCTACAATPEAREVTDAEQVRGATVGLTILAAERDRLRGLIEDALPMLALFRAYEVTPTQIENLNRLLSRAVPGNIEGAREVSRG